MNNNDINPETISKFLQSNIHLCGSKANCNRETTLGEHNVFMEKRGNSSLTHLNDFSLVWAMHGLMRKYFNELNTSKCKIFIRITLLYTNFKRIQKACIFLIWSYSYFLQLNFIKFRDRDKLLTSYVAHPLVSSG